MNVINDQYYVFWHDLSEMNAAWPSDEGISLY